jgi:MFS family permease
MLAIFGYHQSVLGSIAPFLRDEMTLTKVEVGWHFSIYALGLFIGGRIISILSRYYATSTLMVVSAWLMVGFVALLATPMSMIGTLIASFCLGLSGSALQVTVQEALARHHGDSQGIALTEGFVFGGFGVFIGPLVIGLTVKMGLGWRETLAVPTVLLGILFLTSRGVQPAPAVQLVTARAVTGSQAQRLPLAVHLVFGMILLGIATEWGIGFWGAQFLETHLSVSPETGVTLMSVFFGGTVIGRIFASRLLRAFEVHTMLIVAFVLGGASVFMLWGVPLFPATVVALAIAGMCLGNFFPLILSIANEFAPDRPGPISAGATQAVGLALLVVPVLLGHLGETIGLSHAVGLLAFVPFTMLTLYGLSTSLRTKATE